MMRLIFAAIVAISTGLPALAQDAGSRLAVTGSGTVEVEPDIAVAQIGVGAEGETADAAVSAMSDAAAAMLAGLLEQGIAAADVQTGRLSLRPVYADRDRQDGPGAEGPRIVGYAAETGMSVTIRDLDRLGGVLSRAVEDGGNRFDGLSWQVSDRSAAEDAALAAAVAEAMRKASVMAQAAGVALDGVLELREDGAQVSPPMPMMEARLASADVPVARGSVEVRATVSMVYSVSDQ